MSAPSNSKTSAKNFKKKVYISNPEYTEDVHLKNKHRMELLKPQSARLSESREGKKVMLPHAVGYGNDPEAPIKLAMTENDIYETNYKASIYLEIHLTDSEKP